MENIPAEKTETKVPRKGLAVASLACGILSLAGGTILVWLTPIVVVSLADSNLLFVLPLLAVVFGAVPLYQGQGTDWDGKRMAEAGLSTGTVTLLAFLLYYTRMSLMYMPGFMGG
jgi:hypothetical protein